MTTELWLRDPTTYALDAVTNGFKRFTFTWSSLQRAKIDPLSYMRKWCIGTNTDVEFMVIGPQGASHYRGLSRHENPVGVYPVWTPDMSIRDLEDMMASPVGEENPEIFESLPDGLRPREGQEHRVVISKFFHATAGPTKSLLQEMNLLAIQYPDCKLHVHEMQHFGLMFSNEFYSADFHPVGPAFGRPMWIYLPNGIMLQQHDRPEWGAYEEWINMLGFQLRQVSTDRRILTAFNMRSAEWASKYFTSDLTLKMRYRPTLDEAGVPRVSFKPATQGQRKRALTAAVRSTLYRNRDTDTDFVLCNWCMYRSTCKLVRVDSVCIYKGADTVALADAFGSRNADRIIDGLTDLLKMQADRTERAVQDEAISGETDLDVTRQMNSLFKNGVMLAKLLNPELNGKGVTVNVNNQNNVAAISAADPRQLVSNAVRALEAQGIAREDITEDLIRIMLQNPGQDVRAIAPPKQIEGVIMPVKEGY